MLKFFSTDCALVCGHRYYHRTVGGDAAVGRYAVGLKLGEPNHTVLPAHFHPADGGLIRQEWLDLCPAYDRYPEAFRRTALPFLLAVLIYHIDRGDFDGLFPDAHPYRLSRVFQTRPHFVKLKAMLVCGKLGSCDGCAMVASGTSVMASCLLELAELKDLVRSNTIGIASFKQELHRLQDFLKQELPLMLSDCVTDKILERSRIEGVCCFSCVRKLFWINIIKYNFLFFFRFRIK